MYLKAVKAFYVFIGVLVTNPLSVLLQVRDIIPSPDIMQAMELQMSAERRKRADILESEGRRASQVNDASGASHSIAAMSSVLAALPGSAAASSAAMRASAPDGAAACVLAFLAGGAAVVAAALPLAGGAAFALPLAGGAAFALPLAGAAAFALPLAGGMPATQVREMCP